MTKPTAKPFLKVIVVSLSFFILTLGANAKTTSQTPPVGDKMARQQAQSALQNIALPFIENRGQIDQAVAYYVKASQGAVFLTRNGELVFDFVQTDTEDGSSAESMNGPRRRVVFKIKPVRNDDDRNPIQVRGRQLTPAKINYFKGKQEDWLGGIPTYKEVVYDGLFKDTRVIFQAGAGMIEDVYELEPGADPSQIRFQVEGAQSLRVDADGALQIKTAAGEFAIRPPFAFQEIVGQRVKVPCRFDVEGMQFGFQVDDYNRMYALVIDPQMVYGTFWGGEADENTFGVVDSNNLIYIAGRTSSSDFPTTTGSYSQNYTGNTDIFLTIARSPAYNGTFEIIYSTYLGGTNDDGVNRISVDATGKVYMVGSTASSDYPTTTGCYQSSYSGGDYDMLLSVLDPVGNDASDLVYSTYLGGSDSDKGLRLAFDNGLVYVAGQTYSVNFPTTSGAFDENYNSRQDASISVINPAGNGASDLVYSTYLGGNNMDHCRGIGVENGKIYIAGTAGYTSDSTFPTTAGAYSVVCKGVRDAFLSILEPNGNGSSDLLYSTFIGGNDGGDNGQSISVQNGIAYLTGYTDSTDFPTTNGAFNQNDQSAASRDIFVSVFNPQGNGSDDLIYSTYIGGNGLDEPYDTTLSGNRLLISGYTESTDFPTSPDAFIPSSDVTDVFGDGFLFILNPLGQGSDDLVYSTYIGAEDNDAVNQIAVSNGFIYLFGYTYSSNFPVTSDAFDGSLNGDCDGFLYIFNNTSPYPVKWAANNHYYQAVHTPNGISWTDAKTAAENAGGYLATATSQAENEFIFAMVDHPKFWSLDGGGTAIRNNSGPWLGGFFSGPEGTMDTSNWQWVTGEDWNWSNWDFAEPNYTHEKWLNFYSYEASETNPIRQSFWNNYPDEPIVYGYVVEYDNPANGFVTGMVTDINGNPLGGMHVNFYHEPCGGPTPAGYTISQSDGSYAAFMPPGSYYVLTHSPNEAAPYFLDEWYDGASGLFNCNSTQKVSQITVNPNIDWDPDLSPNGGRIVFASNRSGNYDIWIMDSDGGNLKQLTVDSGFETEPTWSPDGTRIAFERHSSDGSVKVYSIAPDGSDLIQLTDFGGQPSWSPDGTRLAFTNNDIFIINTDGTGLTQVTFNSARDWHPAWSPNGDKIAFTSNRNGEDAIWLINIDGTNPTKLANSNENGEPDWSPDGSRIAFEAFNGIFSSICSINTDGTDLKLILSPTEPAADPVWNSDGSQWIFTSWRNGGSDICIVDPQGGGVAPVNVSADQITSDINFTLAGAGRVSGKLTGKSGNPIANACITAYQIACEGNHPLTGTETDANGDYSFFVPEGDIFIAANAHCQNAKMYVDEFWAGDPEQDIYNCLDAIPVKVAANNDILNIDFKLNEGGEIGGRVLDTDGNPIPNIGVHFFTDACSPDAINGATTNSDGYYLSPVLPQGNVYMGVWDHTNQLLYLPEYYNDTDQCDHAVHVPVPSQDITDGIDFTLTPAARIAGTLTDKQGNPITGACITAYTDPCQGDQWLAGTTTDGSGNYSFIVPTGDIYISVGGSCQDQGIYVDEFWGGDDTLDIYHCEDAVAIPAAAFDEIVNIDFKVNEGGFIEGHAFKEDDSFLANTGVHFFGEVCGQNDSHISGTQTDQNGYYKSMALPVGDYYMGCWDPNGALNYFDQWWDHTSDCNAATPVTVTANNTVSGIDFRPIRGTQRISWFEIAVYNSELGFGFDPLPGFENLVESAVLTGPNAFSEALDIQNDKVNWTSDCDYMLFWWHVVGATFDYGQYTLVVTFADGAVRTYTRDIQPVSLTAVDGNSTGITVNSDGSINFTWTAPSATQLYQIRIYGPEGRIFKSQWVMGAENAYASPYDARCLVIGQTYDYEVRTSEGWNFQRIEKTEHKPFVYNPTNHADRIAWFVAEAADGLLALDFSLRPGSKDNITSATVTGPDSFQYTFDLTNDYWDMSTEGRIIWGWGHKFNPPIAYGVYTLEVTFSDGYSETFEASISASDVIPVDAATMNAAINENGSVHFTWAIPAGGEGQQYQVRVRSADGIREYYKSDMIPDGTEMTAGTWDLRTLEPGQTYLWFVRAFDDEMNRAQSQSLPFTYSTVQFSATAYQAMETSSSIEITVERTQTNGPVSVQYSTFDGTAEAGSDYTAESGLLYWADGDNSSRTFTISITNDGVAEGNETVNLRLLDPSGKTALGNNGQAVLTIAADHNSNCMGDFKIADINGLGITDSAHTGRSVAIQGDYAIIGTPYDDERGTDAGAAHIYYRSGAEWIHLVKLTASDAAAGDGFGASVALSDDIAIIGAGNDGDNGTWSGSAYVFQKGASWSDATQVAKLTASDGAAWDIFGISVGISGDTAVVSAYADDDGGETSGSVYVFEKGASWNDMTETAKLTASDAAADDQLGRCVAINGDTIVVGAHKDDDNGSGSGSVYVFEKGTAWTNGSVNQTAKLTASDGVAEDRLGYSVAISGDTIVAGAGDSDDNGDHSGSAYVFVKPMSGWSGALTESAKLIASDADAGDHFGETVKISGETAIIGAYLNDDDGDNSGSVYVFVKPNDGWDGVLNETVKLTADDAAAGDWFGEDIAIDGNTILVRARQDGGTTGLGSAYVFCVNEDEEGPEINIKQDTTAIPDGGTYDFGGKTVGSDTDVVFTIENLGAADLTLTTPLAITGTDADQFSIQADPTSPVGAGSTTTFTVRFSPTSEGAKTAAISIGNNDGDENPYILTIIGNSAPIPVPEINLKQGTTNISDGGGHAFGSKTVGTDTDAVFTIENLGAADLSLTTPLVITGANADQFSIQADPTSPVGADGATTFTLRFSPTSTGTKTAAISIGNNDSNEDPYDLTLTGAGTDTAPPNCIQFDKDTSTQFCNNGTGWISHDWWVADASFTAAGMEVKSEIVNSETHIQIKVNDTVVAEWYAGVGIDIHSEHVNVDLSPGDTISYVLGNGCVTGPIYVKFCDSVGPRISVSPDAMLEDDGELQVIASFSGPGSRSVGIVSVGDNLYVSDNIDKKVYTIDKSGNLITSFDTPVYSNSSPGALEYDGANLWLADSGGDKITQLDTSGNVLSSFASPGDVASGIAYDGANLWHVDYYDDLLFKLDFDGNIIEQHSITGHMYGDLTYDGEFLWLLRSDNDTIYRIDFSGNQIGPAYDAPSSNSGAIDFDGDYLWYTDWSDNIIYQLDIPDGTPMGGQTSLTFTITNSGDQTLNIGAINITGDDAQDFNLVNDNCMNTSVAPSETCTLDVEFSPLSEGYKQAMLQIASDDPAAPVKLIPLEGNALVGVRKPEISITEDAADMPNGGSYDFGTKMVGTVTDVVFSIKNIGTADLTLATPISISAFDEDHFSIEAQPSSTVGPGNTTALTVRFSPASQGSKTVTIRIPNNDADENPYILRLTGAGTAAEPPNCIQFDQDTSTPYCNTEVGWISHDWWIADTSFSAASMEVQSEVINSGTYIQIRINGSAIAEWYADVGTDIHTEGVDLTISEGDAISFVHGNDSYGCVTGPVSVKFCTLDGPMIAVDPSALIEDDELREITSFDGPGSRSVGIVAVGDQLYVADNIDKKVYHIDKTGNLISSFDTPYFMNSSPSAIEYDGVNLWLSDSGGDKIVELDTSGNLIQSFDSPGEVASGIAYDGANLWHVDYYDDFLYKLDSDGNILEQAAITGNMYGDLTYDGEYLWLTAEYDTIIYRIDFNGNPVGHTYQAPTENTGAIDFDGDSLWYTDWEDNIIYQLDIPDLTAVGGTSAKTFTITNIGSQTLNIGSLVITGSDAQDFNLANDNCSNQSIAPSGTCTLVVEFSPLSQGYKTALLEIPSNDPNTPVKQIPLEGNKAYGSGLPFINLVQGGATIPNSGSYDFGVKTVGSDADTLFSIENIGAESLTLTTPLTVSGADADQFSIEANPTSPVEPGNTTAFTVRFSPSSVGVKSAAISIANNDSDENPYVLNITGEGADVSVPEMNLKQDSTDIPDNGAYDFGGKTVGTGTDAVFTIENIGAADLSLTTPLTISGADADQFTIEADPGSIVGAGGTTTFTVRFSPTSAGAKSATISIANNDSDENPYVLNIHGDGADAPEPEINLTGNPDFGNTTVGTCTDRVFTIENSGSADLTLSVPFTISGVDADQFSIEDDPASPVVAGNTTTFTVRFCPASEDAKTATISISSNDSDENPYNLVLNGTGSPAGTGGCIQFDKDLATIFCNNGAGWIPHDWWEADTAFTAASMEVKSQVVNSGTFIRIKVNEKIVGEWYADVGEDIHTQAVDVTIAPGDTINYSHGNDIYGCVTGPIYVKFCGADEQEINLKQGAVSIPDGGNYDFGSQTVGTNTDAIFTIENLGAADLTLATPLSITGTDADQFSIEADPTSPVSAGGATTFTVRFSPTSEGAKTAAISIGNNDSDENPYVLNISGNGVVALAPEINLTGNPDFGITPVGLCSDRVFTIENIGSADLALTVPLTINGADADQFSIEVNPASPVESGNTTSLTVRFCPTSAGAKTATISIGNNDGDENPYVLNITGQGVVLPKYGSMQFSTTAWSVNENGGAATIEVTRTDGSDGAVSVQYATSNGSASAGSDYTAASGTLNWADGDDSTKTFSVAISDDALTEGAETVNLTLSNPTGGATLGSPDTAVLTIQENASGTVRFDAISYIFNEDAGEIAIAVLRTGSSQGAVSVEYSTYDSTAAAGADYTATSGTLEWADGDATAKNISIPLLYDDLFEGDEIFHVNLFNPDGALLGTPSETVVVIRENEAGLLQFAGGPIIVHENAGAVTVYIERLGGSDGAIGVQYNTQNETALAGNDYTAVNGSLNWADGVVTPQAITIPLLNDAIAEGDETLRLVLSNPTGGAQLIDPPHTQVQIVDYEAGVLELEQDSVTVKETDIEITVAVTRTGSRNGAVSVDFATTNGTATADSDYTGVNGTLNWADGDSTPRFIQIPILTDADVEGDETFNLILNNPMGGALLGAISQMTITIADDFAGIVQFDADQYIASESDGVFEITVSRTIGYNGAITVKCATTGGTAQDGVDYASVDATLAWEDSIGGEYKITIPIAEDAVAEGDETFTLTLSDPTGGATIGGVNPVTLTIQDSTVVVKGDLNGDGQTDLVDAIIALQVITGVNPPQLRADYAVSGADVNGDDRVGMEELIYILQHEAELR